MILMKKPRIVRAGAFLDGLHAAAQAALQVRVGDSAYGSSCTAWLITDTLVVLPDYVVNQAQGRYACLTASEPPDTIEADLVSSPLKGPLGEAPALLRLRKPLPGLALKWRAASIEEGDQIFLLHYPLGERPLSLSLGEVVSVADSFVQYDADTEDGSAGAPILDGLGELVGMHMSSGSQQAGVPLVNQGLSLRAILDVLRQTPGWADIASYHNLADATAAREALAKSIVPPPPPAPDEPLLRAAISWEFDPASFPEPDRERLARLVIDEWGERWVLRAEERQRLLQSAGSLEVLRNVRGSESTDEPGQRVIDRILQGPPYKLDDIAEADLPYWLQAVRWFADVAPELPTPAQVNRTLERLRVRSRPRDVAGPGFRGRDKELEKLRTWYAGKQPGPMVVTGIGGVGKSALIAKFALDLPDSTMLLWLDFDRADLAPDDAISVLRHLFEQAALQAEGFTAPEFKPETWQASATSFGAALAQRQKKAPPPLLVLDGFEVAQHTKSYTEIWQVLELILAEFPTLRVLVSGRAQVPNLTLHKRPASNLNLTGMARPDAEAWLREAGVTGEKVLRRVLDVSHCVPLALLLALRWLAAGGDVEQLPDALPNELVDGFLYRRILDRVIDPVLKPVARSALVLRRLTPEMIPEVLGDAIPKDLSAQEVFGRLSREMGLVETGGESPSLRMPSLTVPGNPDVLQLRPEVRSATLRLLEMENSAHVRAIDERAAAWYAKQDLEQVANRAELVYHRLRLGDLAGAEQAWHDNCAPLLLYAEDELLPDARAWLHERLRGAVGPDARVEAWENNAAERIRAALGRGLRRAVPDILAERVGRSAASPLLLYDAWTRWNKDGDPAGAREILSAAGQADGAVARDRAVLAALLAQQAGDRREADRQLAQVDDPERWRDRPSGALEALAVQAARVRLTVDLQREMKLNQILEKRQDDATLLDALHRFLEYSDVMLTPLSQQLQVRSPFESYGASIPIPSSVSELPDFASGVFRARGEPLRDPASFGSGMTKESAFLNADLPWQASDLSLDAWTADLLKGPLGDGVELGLTLAIGGWRRWRLVTSNLFLAQAIEQALQSRTSTDLLSGSVAWTLAVFSGGPSSGFGLSYMDTPLNRVLDKVVASVRQWAAPIAANQLLFAAQLFEDVSTQYPEFGNLARTLKSATGSTAIGSIIPDLRFVLGELSPEQKILVLYVIGAEPLDMLVRHIVGVPDELIL